MLDKSHRLRTQKDFARLFSRGRTFHGDRLILKYVSGGKDKIKVGFVVSAKTAKDAVARNKLKRRLRAIVRPFIARLAVGHDVVIISKPGSVEMSFDQLAASVRELLIRAKLISLK